MTLRLISTLTIGCVLFLLAISSSQVSASPGDSPRDRPDGPAKRVATVGDSATVSPPPTPSPDVDPFERWPLEPAREFPAPPAGARLPSEVDFGPYTRRVRASFRIRVRDVVIPYRVLGVTAMPGERLEISVDEVWGEGSKEEFRLRSPERVEVPEEPGRWSWDAPTEPGPVPLRVESLRDGDAITLNVFVLHSFEEASHGSMNGFEIGQYRPPEGHRPPNGFVEAAQDVLDLLVAPGFTLRQFLPHQPGDPRYLALSEPLLLKLEAILEEVRASGIEARTLHVMSAFRTPHYNRAIGNTTEGSRHLWGDAADIFIDESGDGWMDDLTGDGRGGEADARLLHRLVEQVEARSESHVRPGGLSLYRANNVRGPFLHVDARGLSARW